MILPIIGGVYVIGVFKQYHTPKYATGAQPNPEEMSRNKRLALTRALKWPISGIQAILGG